MDRQTVADSVELMKQIDVLKERVKTLGNRIDCMKNGANHGISFSSDFSLYVNDAVFGETVLHFFRLTHAMMKDALEDAEKRFAELQPLKKTQG